MKYLTDCTPGGGIWRRPTSIYLYMKFKEDNGENQTSKDKTDIVNIIRTWD
jgi:hypothetical protein